DEDEDPWGAIDLRIDAGDAHWDPRGRVHWRRAVFSPLPPEGDSGEEAERGSVASGSASAAASPAARSPGLHAASSRRSRAGVAPGRVFERGSPSGAGERGARGILPPDMEAIAARLRRHSSSSSSSRLGSIVSNSAWLRRRRPVRRVVPIL
ncbi:unnamed protein product, partial [Prorocentrum cordatum]